jgi:Mrp family chromosome partitioning ATPase
VNDPDETMRLPIVELGSEPNGTSARGAFVQKDTIIPPKNPMSHPTITADAASIRLEPTVFSAIRRYRVIVLAVAILGMVAGIAYSAKQPKVYRAEANVTVPLPASSPAASADPGQYLDGQVLVMQSQSVAQRAADIANSKLGSNTLEPSNFDGSSSSLKVNPPATATPGGYGASIVAVSFQGPSAEIAQAGLSAVLQAFDEAESDAIKAQAKATIAGINEAIRQSTSPDQRAALLTQREQAIVNEQTDLVVRTPTAAVGPTTRVNGHLALYGGIGFVLGILVGAALAYALAIRRPSINGPEDPAVVYGVPLIAETPAFKTGDGLPPVYAKPHSAVAEGFRFAAGSVERICAARGTPLSLAFVSPLARPGNSAVVANLALSIAQSGMRLLVVDASAADDGVTAWLLPGVPITAGFEQALGGQRALADFLQASTFNETVAVLGSDPSAPRLMTGAARSSAVRALLANAWASFDIVLIDSPGVLQAADTADLVSAADAAIIVVNPHDLIANHLETARWLRASGSNVIGYLYNRGRMRSHGTHGKRYGDGPASRGGSFEPHWGVETSDGGSGRPS